jgi:hypothetical protein
MIQPETTVETVPSSTSAAGAAAPFQSILFPKGESSEEIDRRSEPDCFPDLNLDQVVTAVTAARDEYNLKPFYYASFRDRAVIQYRHDVFRDLERPPTVEAMRCFASAVQGLRGYLGQAEKLYYERQKQRCLLDGIDIYCGAVRRLAKDLSAVHVESDGLTALRQYLTNHIDSQTFRAMESEMRSLLTKLGQVQYALHIDGKRVTVRRDEPAPDYGADVLETFEKFRQEAAKEYHFLIRSAPEMNHVEAAILDRVARLYPELFSSLAEFSACHGNFVDPTIARFDREVQFYLAWIEYTQQLSTTGLSFCYPSVSSQSKEVHAREAFDLALAERLHRLDRANAAIVVNDVSLTGPERIVVVTGPNQGGKTTFARMFGQLHYLAGIGCPVPAKEAALFLCDRLFTHFEKEEDVQNLTGKLEDELIRIHRILESATPDSILIMNESFLSTTLNDALFLSQRVMELIVVLDMLCVSVTFLDELASMSTSTVSMAGTVEPDNPSQRTFRIIRKPADGLAYAMAIAEKYRLTQEAVKGRIARNSAERSR